MPMSATIWLKMWINESNLIQNKTKLIVWYLHHTIDFAFSFGSSLINLSAISQYHWYCAFTPAFIICRLVPPHFEVNSYMSDFNWSQFQMVYCVEWQTTCLISYWPNLPPNLKGLTVTITPHVLFLMYRTHNPHGIVRISSTIYLYFM